MIWIAIVVADLFTITMQIAWCVKVVVVTQMENLFEFSQFPSRDLVHVSYKTTELTGNERHHAVKHHQ